MGYPPFQAAFIHKVIPDYLYLKQSDIFLSTSYPQK